MKFEQLYMSYKNLMYKVAIEMLGDSDYADDAVQQAFLSIIEYIDKLQNISNEKMPAFMATVTKRKAIDILRSKRKTVNVEFEENIFYI